MVRHVVFLSFYPELIPRHRLMVKALSTEGWQVSVVCWDRETAAGNGERDEGYFRVYTVNVPGKTASAGILLSMPALYASLNRQLSALPQFSVVFLPHYFLLPLTYSLRLKGLKYIYDAPEYFCEDISGYFGKLRCAFRPIVGMLEKILLKRVDGIFTIDSNDGWLSDYYNAMRKPVQVIWNLPAKEDEPSQEAVENTSKKYFGRRLIVYAGAIKLDKGIDVILHSIPQIVEKYSDVLFLFIGQVQEYDNEIVSFIKRHKLENHVRLSGKMDYTDMLTHIKAAEMGLTILRGGRNDYAGRGNCRKVFTYMQAAVPQLVTDVGQIGEFVKENNVGLVIEPNSIDAVTAGILQYLDNPGLREIHGRTARTLFTSKYNWEMESSSFTTAYNRLIDAGQ